MHYKCIQFYEFTKLEHKIQLQGEVYPLTSDIGR